MKIINISFVGLGNQSREYMNIIQFMENVKISSVCDLNQKIAQQVSIEYSTTYYTSVDEMARNGDYDIIILCLPHSEYFNAIRSLARPGVRFIKEKPFASSFSEAKILLDLIDTKLCTYDVLLRRRFNPAYQFVADSIDRIGAVYSAEFTYTLAIDRLDEGWRAKRDIAGGGALIDMGYHLIDLVIWFLGMPEIVMARTSGSAKPDQKYDVEDTAHLLLAYEPTTRRPNPLSANLLISRSYGEKGEKVRIVGTNGVIVADPRGATLLSHDGQIIEHHGNSVETAEILNRQLAALIQASNSPTTQDSANTDPLLHHAIIEAAYHSSKTGGAVPTSGLLKGRISHEHI